nr:MAG TPA: hypothetical protein [Caudoviricetes sp.]
MPVINLLYVCFRVIYRLPKGKTNTRRAQP